MKLPQCEIFFNGKFKNWKDEKLLVAGGRTPNRKYFSKIAQGRKILAIDKGIEICRAENILPELLIGDFDSAENSAVAWAKENKVPVKRYPVDKDFTDTQLALELVEGKIVLLTGIFGGRLDHLFSNVFTCANSNLKIVLADEQEIIFFLQGAESVEVNFFEKPLAISLLPVSEVCEGVSINNVRWKLENAKLFQKIPSAISNRLEGDKIKLNLHAGTLAIYFVFG